MNCLSCGEETFKIEGLHFDSDQMRSARFCNDCKIVYGVYAHGMVKEYILKDLYDAPAKQRIIGYLYAAIKELEGK